MLLVPDLHGFYDRERVKRVYSCPICRGGGQVVHDFGDDFKLADCQCILGVKRDYERLAGNIPPEFWETAQRNPADGVAGARIDEYVRDIRARRATGQGLLIVGDLGRGKTTAACHVLLTAIRAGYTAGYITTGDYLDSLYVDDVALIGFRSGIVEADFFCIDEFGNEYRKRGSTHAETELNELLRQRRSKQLPTIICANLPKMSDFRARCGDMAYSLVAGMTVVPFSGVDRRRS